MLSRKLNWLHLEVINNNSVISALSEDVEINIILNDITMRRVLTIRSTKNALLKLEDKSVFKELFGFTRTKCTVGVYT